MFYVLDIQIVLLCTCSAITVNKTFHITKKSRLLQTYLLECTIEHLYPFFNKGI